jgi:beta-glucanase (GH16 family)
LYVWGYLQRKTNEASPVSYFVNPLNFQNRALPVSGAPQHWFSATTKQTLTGTSGNDAIYGAGGDILVGGGGDDTYYVNSSDKVVEAPGGGIDTIVTYWGSYILPDNVENLVVQGDGAYAGGNALDNLITAVGTGEHTLNGGGGNNVLTGGTGKDIFVHDNGTSNDVITNFQPGLDEVRLDNYSFFTFDAVHSAMQQVGSDVVLNLGANDSLTFRNVQVSQFSVHDFMLPLDHSKLHMTFDDEFNSLSLHSSSGGTWNTSFAWAGQTGATLTGELEWYINSAYAPTSAVHPWTVSNGILDLTAAPTDASTLQAIGNHPYTSGMLTTSNSFAQTYGYFEMRAELPVGKGLAPAFWLLPEDGSWPPELDVMEVIGSNPTALVTTVHSNSTGHPTAVGETTTVADTTVGFHTYGVDWEPDTITWYFDGNEVFQTATPADMRKPMFMVLNLAVGGVWPGAPDGSTAFPASMQIDFVHAYATTAAPPAILAFSPDTNIVGDGITNSNNLTLTGTSEAFSTVNIFDGTTLIGTATANGLGAWSYLTGILTDGSHKFTATDTNAAGNTSAASSILTVTVDTHVPNTTAIQSVTTAIQSFSTAIQSFSSTSNVVGDGITSANHLTLAGTADANSTVKVYDGTALLGSAQVNSGGAWTFTTGLLGNSTHKFTATDMDAAGTASAASSALNVTVDTHIPKAAVIKSFSPDSNIVGDGITNANHLTLAGTAEANSTVKVFDGTALLGSAQVNSGGAWTFTSGLLADGVHKFTTTDTDAAGTTGATSSALNVTVDTHVTHTPVINSISSNDGIINVNHLITAGTAEANSTVKVFDGATALGSAHVGSDGAWTFTTGLLSNGAHNFTATDTDAAGTSSAASSALHVTVDTVAPSPAITNVVHNQDSPATLSGTSEAHSTISVYDGASHTLVGTTMTGDTGAWSLTSGALSGTVHSFTAQATDLAGNTGVAPGATIYGTAAGQTLNGAPNALLVGLDASDTFAFAPHFGKEAVTGFNASGATHDVLQLDHTVFSTFAAVLSHAAQVGNDLVITADAADVITFHNVNKSALQASDVHII